jgi:hypothetical protein
MAKAKQKILHSLVLSLLIVLPRSTAAESTPPDDKCSGHEIFCGIDPIRQRPESNSGQKLDNPSRDPAVRIAHLGTLRQTRQELQALDASLRLRALRPVWENNCSQDVTLSRRECRELAAKILELTGCQQGTGKAACRKICSEMFDPKRVDISNLPNECSQKVDEQSNR